MTTQPDYSKAESQSGNKALKAVETYQQIQADIAALLVMPTDCLELYQDALLKRMVATGIDLTIVAPGFPPDIIGSYEQVLSFQCPLPESGLTVQEESSTNGQKQQSLHALLNFA